MAVIADTNVSGSVEKVNETIPFIGLLTGSAYIGHCVVVFDGQLSMVADGCRDSDVLIIDDAVLPRLQDEWYSIATKVMRRPEIYVHDRKAYTLRPVLPGPRR